MAMVVFNLNVFNVECLGLGLALQHAYILTIYDVVIISSCPSPVTTPNFNFFLYGAKPCNLPGLVGQDLVKDQCERFSPLPLTELMLPAGTTLFKQHLAKLLEKKQDLRYKHSNPKLMATKATKICFNLPFQGLGSSVHLASWFSSFIYLVYIISIKPKIFISFNVCPMCLLIFPRFLLIFPRCLLFFPVFLLIFQGFY